MTTEQLKDQPILHGWIKPCTGEDDVTIYRRELESFGIRVGIWDMFQSEFQECSVPISAFAQLDLLWGKYIWGLK